MPLAIALIVLNIVGIVLLGWYIDHIFLSILGYIIALVVLANISENAMVWTLVAGGVITLIVLIGMLVLRISEERGWKKWKNEQDRKDSDLLDAVNKGDRQAAQRLIEQGASVNPTDGFGGKPTLLQIAVEKGDKDMVSLLLDKGGADVNWGHNGRCPLDCTEDDEMIALLKSRGAKTLSEVFEMGCSFYTGEGAAKDYEKAVEWLEKAARSGHAAAQYSLGLCYAEGTGVAQNEYIAVAWYEKAAEQGYAFAQNDVGACYHNGTGVTQDYGKAAEWYRKAAEQGNAVAQFNLGRCYASGWGVVQNDEKMVEWFRKAAEQGYTDAMHGLGLVYLALNRFGEAKEWFAKAAAQGHQRALEELRNLQ